MRSTEDLAIADEVFRTGKTGMNLVIASFGTLLVAVGVGSNLNGSLNLSNMLCGMLLALPGAAIAAAALFSRRNSVVALFPEGLVFRNWRAEEVFIPWEAMCEVFAELRDTAGKGNARWLVCVVSRTDAGEVRQTKLAAPDEKDQAMQLASALARAASLTHRDAPPATMLKKILNRIASTPREVWDRTPGGEAGQPSHPEGGDAAKAAPG